MLALCALLMNTTLISLSKCMFADSNIKFIVSRVLMGCRASIHISE